MTENKMIRILQSYEDVALFEIVDKYDYDFDKDEFTGKVRDIILLSDIIEEFKNKSGNYYKFYCFTDSFKDLVKLIEIGKTSKIEKTYDDTREWFNDEWEKRHPGVSYERWRREHFNRLERAFVDIANNYFPWECGAMPYYYYGNHRQYVNRK